MTLSDLEGGDEFRCPDNDELPGSFRKLNPLQRERVGLQYTAVSRGGMLVTIKLSERVERVEQQSTSGVGWGSR